MIKFTKIISRARKYRELCCSNFLFIYFHSRRAIKSKGAFAAFADTSELLSGHVEEGFSYRVRGARGKNISIYSVGGVSSCGTERENGQFERGISSPERQPGMPAQSHETSELSLVV